MRAFTPTKLITKSHVGRPCDFLGHDGQVYNGRVVEVKRGFAGVWYYVPGESGEFRALPHVREQRVEVY